MPKFSPAPANKPSHRGYYANAAFALLFAVAVTASYGQGGATQAQLDGIGSAWLMRTLIPFAQQTLSPEKFAEFMRTINGTSTPAPVAPPAATHTAPVNVPTAVSSTAPAIVPTQPVVQQPVTVSPEPVLYPGEWRCELRAPSPLCSRLKFPKFLSESCTNGTDTGWMYTCIDLPPPPIVTSLCGNGILGGDEECDEGDNNADESNKCRVDCTFPRCGDSIVDAGEQCDDGNEDFGDGCEVCHTSVCGDGVPGPFECGEIETIDCAPGDFCPMSSFVCGPDCPER